MLPKDKGDKGDTLCYLRIRGLYMYLHPPLC